MNYLPSEYSVSKPGEAPSKIEKKGLSPNQAAKLLENRQKASIAKDNILIDFDYELLENQEVVGGSGLDVRILETSIAQGKS